MLWNLLVLISNSIRERSLSGWSSPPFSFYYGNISTNRKARIAGFWVFQWASFLSTTWGSYFCGKPKVRYLQPIADKIKSRLSTWKDYLISAEGSVQLVKYVVQRMLLYSFMVFRWPTTLLNSVDTCMRNFIFCFPTIEGGLDHRSIKYINKTTSLKLCWIWLSSILGFALIIVQFLLCMNLFGGLIFRIVSSNTFSEPLWSSKSLLIKAFAILAFVLEWLWSLSSHLFFYCNVLFLMVLFFWIFF